MQQWQEGNSTQILINIIIDVIILFRFFFGDTRENKNICHNSENDQNQRNDISFCDSVDNPYSLIC